MKIHVAIPPVEDLYPCRAVHAGLKRLGHTILGNDRPLDADMLVVWSPWRKSRREALFSHYQNEKRPILVMENGWLSPIRRVPFYQIAFDGWNGTGRFFAGGAERFASWGVRIAPWTRLERHLGFGLVLVAGQRGHPYDARTALPDWHVTVDLGPGGQILRRPHDCVRALSVDLAAAAEVHVWTSNVAAHAILAGVPVVQHGPNLMVSKMASRPGQPLYRGNRIEELERLAWAQWEIGDIISGRPFEWLLAHRQESA